MPVLEVQTPAQNRGKFHSRCVARDGTVEKMMKSAEAELPMPDLQQVLRKRLRAEMEALRGLVKKAEILAGKAANNVVPARRRFSEAEARVRVDTKEEREEACAKKRKTMPPVAKIVESTRMLPSKAVNGGTAPRRVKEARRLLDADARPEAAEEQSTDCADKKRKAMEIVVEPRTPKREIVSHGSFVPSLSTNMPTHAKEVANASVPICRSPPDQQEEGEIVEEEGGDDVFVDICGVATPVSAPEVRCSSPGLPEFKKREEDDVLVVGKASPVTVQTIAEAENSPSSSSSSSSGSSCSDSSDSDSSSSSGSSCSDSSDSDSSDSDDEAESVGSSPAPAFPAQRNASPEQVSSKVLCSPQCSREEGEFVEDECVGASPVAAEKFAEPSNSPRSTISLGSADNKSVGSSPCPVIFSLPSRDEAPEEKPMTPQTAAPSVRQAAAVPAPPMSNLLAKARMKMRQLRREPKRQKAYEELEAMDRNAVPTNWIHPKYMVELGITVVEYVMTSDRLVPGRGGPLEQLFGLSWKGE